MTGVATTFGEDVDPEVFELKLPFAEIEVEILSKRLNLSIQLGL